MTVDHLAAVAATVVSNNNEDWSNFYTPIFIPSYEEEDNNNMAHQMLSNMSGVEADFPVVEILESLRGFKGIHIQQYKDALEVYQKDIIGQTITTIKELNDIIVSDTPITDFNYHNTISYNFNKIKAPINCEKEYDKLINMFEYVQGDTVKLNFNEANRIFNNDWEWVASAAATNLYYSSRKMS